MCIDKTFSVLVHHQFEKAPSKCSPINVQATSCMVDYQHVIQIFYSTSAATDCT
jgi:hypothetical protein